MKKKHLYLVAQTVKCLSAMQEAEVWSPCWEDPLQKEMAAHSRTLAWKIPWTEEPGRLQPMGLQRVGHHWTTSLSLHIVTSEEKERAIPRARERTVQERKTDLRQNPAYLSYSHLWDHYGWKVVNHMKEWDKGDYEKPNNAEVYKLWQGVNILFWSYRKPSINL